METSELKSGRDKVEGTIRRNMYKQTQCQISGSSGSSATPRSSSMPALMNSHDRPKAARPIDEVD